jgi:hypothetical protein
MDQSLQLRAILLGGLIGGLLSAIPGLGIMTDCCCCGGFVSLGALAGAFYYVQKTNIYPRDADGLIIGLGAGALAGAIAGLANAVIQLLTPKADMLEGTEELVKLLGFLPPQFQEVIRQSMEQSAQQPRGAAVVMSMLMIVVLSCLAGALFGFLGLRFFRSRRLHQAATPTPPYGYYMPPPPVGPRAIPPAPPFAPPFAPPTQIGAPPIPPPAPPAPAGIPWGPADQDQSGPGDEGNGA